MVQFGGPNLAHLSDFQPRRGRPRNLPQMGEFDLSLINEFRSRPSFYDRSTASFKDKLYNAHQWQEISNKLGFDVSILKDRILQLRNRYNLEKRRIEQLREENPNKFYESPWPLYEHLHFLSDHIRARRSYKKMLPLNGGGGGGPFVAMAPEFSNSCSTNSNLTFRRHTNSGATAGGDRESNSSQNMSAFPNGLLAVKMEDESEDNSEQETESPKNNSEIHAFDTSGLIPDKHSPHLPAAKYLQQEKQQHYAPKQQKQQQQQKKSAISIRHMDSLRQDYADSSTSNYNRKLLQQQQQQQHQQQQNFQQTSSSFNQSSMQTIDESAASGVPSSTQTRFNARELKYAAFGNFISSSLSDLPPTVALDLVEKFTSDIVKVLMENAQREQQQQQLLHQQLLQQQQQQQQQQQRHDSEN